jgi:hypothetical protein
VTPIRAIFAGSAGNLVEWYDWYVYSAFSLYCEYVALWFKTRGMERGFYGYVTMLVAISLVVYVRMRETKQSPV